MKTVIEILIDISGSMGSALPPENKRKIDLAKEILIDKILPLINLSDSVGIRLFGGQCGIIGQAENIPNADLQRLKDFILNQIPEPNGNTPLALAIRTAVDNLKQETGADKLIYCITDGGETCGGDIIAEANYAASNDIKCRIDIIAIGELDEKAKEQFAYITTKTGGKNLNIGLKGTSKKVIEKELSPLNEVGIDEIVDLIDNHYTKNKEVFKLYDSKTIREYLLSKRLPINYIPSDDRTTCQKLLVIEFYDDNRDLDNLINGLEHIKKCGQANKEVLILMNKWDNGYYSKFFKPWFDLYKAKGIEKFCIKLDGFKAYKEFN
jgi:Ca-activated chloride channel family protein